MSWREVIFFATPGNFLRAALCWAAIALLAGFFVAADLHVRRGVSAGMVIFAVIGWVATALALRCGWNAAKLWWTRIKMFYGEW